MSASWSEGDRLDAGTIPTRHLVALAAAGAAGWLTIIALLVR